MEGRKSIFELERRILLQDAFKGVFADLLNTRINSGLYGMNSLYSIMSTEIKDWPYRDGATSMSMYANYHGFVFKGKSDEDILYSFELLINLLQWVFIHEKTYCLKYSVTVSSEFQRCFENIDFLLEQLNWVIREKHVKNNFPQYIITKRDVDVDSVLATVPELSETLLSYLDVRNQNDIWAKRIILKQIADFLEKKKPVYDGTEYRNLSRDLFMVFNKCNIRHNNDEQIEMDDKQRMALYDQTFKAAVHLIRKETVDEFRQNVEILKTKINKK